MNRSISLLLLSLCSLSQCQDHVYHFINCEKTWQEAQDYCREHYTDLATVFDQADAQRLCAGQADCPRQNGAWIGLRYNDTANRTWHWSQPGLQFTKSQIKLGQGQPDSLNKDKEGSCISAQRCSKGWEWHDRNCLNDLPSICYNSSTNESVVVNAKKTWLEALQFCREHHTDLIRGSQLLPDIQNGCTHYWTGLFRDSWQWSDGSSSSFRNWHENEDILNDNWNEINQCAQLGETGTKWKSDECSEKRAFICYDDPLTLIKENKTFEEAMVHCRSNHGDLAVMANRYQRKMVGKKAKMADTEFVWVGMHYTCFFEEWIWVNGHWVEQGNWVNNKEPHECGLNGAIKRDGKNKWVGKKTGEKYNFICSKSCQYKNSMGTCPRN